MHGRPGCRADDGIAIIRSIVARDQTTRLRYAQANLETALWDADATYAVRVQNNSLYTFIWESIRSTELGRPEDELNAAVCTMKQFPEWKDVKAVDNTNHPAACLGRKSSRHAPPAHRPVTNRLGGV